MRSPRPPAAILAVFVSILLSTMCSVAQPSAAAETPTGATRPERTLSQIVAIPNRFQRNAALYRLVADADRPRIESLLAGLTGIPRAPQRDDVARVLYVRFMSLEPETAVAHALRDHAKPLVLEALFRAWAHADLEAAVARASNLPTVIRQDAARAILDLDLPAPNKAAIAERLGTSPDIAEVERVTPLRTDESYDQALARIVAIEDTSVRYREALSMTTAWAREDPAGALAAILNWDARGIAGGTLLRRAMDIWAAADPRAAVDWLLTREPDEVAGVAGAAFAALARTNLVDAQSLVEALPQGRLRSEAQQSLLAEVLDRRDFDLAIAQFGELDSNDQHRLASGVGRRLAGEDPEGAVAWAMSLNEAVGSSALWSVFDGIQDADLDLAKRLVEELDDLSSRIQGAYAVLRGMEPAESLDWVQTLGSEDETALLTAHVFRIWSARDLPGAIAAAMRYPPGPARDGQLLTMMSSRLQAFDTDAAERLLNAIDSPAGNARAEALLRAHQANGDLWDSR